MALLSMKGVSLNLGGQPLLQSVDLFVEAGERLCLTGRNGAGKSSLLAVLGGQLEADRGDIVRGAVFGMMPQDVPQSWQGTVFSLAAEAVGLKGGIALAQELEGEAALAQNSKGGSAQAQNKYSGAVEDYSDWERYGEVLGMLRHLELDPEADFKTLSGGTKRRVALARALLGSEDLILDEPTNHLDLDSIAWLEDYLLRRCRTLIFVSHDRAFSRRLANRVVELDRGKLYSYSCSYDQYPERREERLEIEAREHALFDKKLAEEEVWIRQGIKARRTRNMGRVRALLGMRDERAARREKQGNARLFAQEAENSGKLVIRAEDISFAYPGQAPLFSNFSTVIQRGDRVGLIGANGSGKSTLLRVLLGELPPTAGRVRLGTNLQISYFDQLRETLNPDHSLMQSVADGNDSVTIDGRTRHVAGYLRDFLFTPDRLRLPVRELSGGERNRLLLARLFTRPSNLLVLDEPTNDLDVETLELLEELLQEYSGTVLLVSHDRNFLDNLVTSVLTLEGDGLAREYVGGYTDWLRQRAPVISGTLAAQGGPTGMRPGEKPGKDIAANEPGLGDAAQSNQGKPRKLTFNEQRELKQLERDLDELPGRLEALEQEQSDLEARLAAPDFFTRDPEGFENAAKRLSDLDGEQTALLQRWEEAEARLEELRTV
ncbi:MAG: ATP-binding cassette domain-containing protein [Deltaproteobacteria bacterium]|jgi:ATP-binding cassette subfamily F protein uup|nr:ATP-binding cassette domain-containing protein [Deltaproteobacteria bacterium]